jgi:hypothetical protein
MDPADSADESESEAQRLFYDALMAACKSVSPDALVELLDNHPHQRVVAAFRDSTPLHHTCFWSRRENARLLLGAGADVRAESDDGDTSLHVACLHDSPELAALLLAYGAVVDARNDLTQTPLHYACMSGCEGCAALLLAAGAEVDARTAVRRTPLHLACQNGHVDSARHMLMAGADVSAVDEERDTPLHKACNWGHVDCAELLLAYGADADARDDEGVTPLHVACVPGKSPECVQLLLQHGADADARDDEGVTPLHVAHWTDVDVARLMDSAARLRAEKGVPVGAPHTLAWTSDTHELLEESKRRAVERALRALLLADVRRAGCALGWDAAESVLQAVAS